MPYVQRDNSKKVTGIYECAQPGFVEEFLDDSDPDVSAFVSSKKVEPLTCSPLQARLALLSAGLLDSVNKYISTLPQEKQLAWEYAGTIYETNEIVQGAASAMGLSADEVTKLFQTAVLL